MAISGNLPTVAVRDPNETYGEIVNQLVRDVTRDLRPTGSSSSETIDDGCPVLDHAAMREHFIPSKGGTMAKWKRQIAHLGLGKMVVALDAARKTISKKDYKRLLSTGVAQLLALHPDFGLGSGA